MSRPVGTVTIAAAGTASGTLAYATLRRARSILIQSPAVLDGATTFTVMVSALKNPGATDWKALQVAGVDVTLTAAKALMIADVPFCNMYILASAAVAADRVFGLSIAEF